MHTLALVRMHRPVPQPDPELPNIRPIDIRWEFALEKEPELCACEHTPTSK